MTRTAWLDDTGLVTLPSGVRVRGRRLSDPASPADFALVLANGPVPAWPHRHIRWPDFWTPVTPYAKPIAAHAPANALRWPATVASAAPELPSLHWPSSTASPRRMRSAWSAAITTTAPLKRHGNDAGCTR